MDTNVVTKTLNVDTTPTFKNAGHLLVMGGCAIGMAAYTLILSLGNIVLSVLEALSKLKPAPRMAVPSIAPAIDGSAVAKPIHSLNDKNEPVLIGYVVNGVFLPVQGASTTPPTQSPTAETGPSIPSEN